MELRWFLSKGLQYETKIHGRIAYLAPKNAPCFYEIIQEEEEEEEEKYFLKRRNNLNHCLKMQGRKGKFNNILEMSLTQ